MSGPGRSPAFNQVIHLRRVLQEAEKRVAERVELERAHLALAGAAPASALVSASPAIETADTQVVATVDAEDSTRALRVWRSNEDDDLRRRGSTTFLGMLLRHGVEGLRSLVPPDGLPDDAEARLAPLLFPPQESVTEEDESEGGDSAVTDPAEELAAEPASVDAIVDESVDTATTQAREQRAAEVSRVIQQAEAAPNTPKWEAVHRRAELVARHRELAAAKLSGHLLPQDPGRALDEGAMANSVDEQPSRAHGSDKVDVSAATARGSREERCSPPPPPPAPPRPVSARPALKLPAHGEVSDDVPSVRSVMAAIRRARARQGKPGSADETQQKATAATPAPTPTHRVASSLRNLMDRCGDRKALPSDEGPLANDYAADYALSGGPRSSAGHVDELTATSVRSAVISGTVTTAPTREIDEALFADYGYGELQSVTVRSVISSVVEDSQPKHGWGGMSPQRSAARSGDSTGRRSFAERLRASYESDSGSDDAGASPSPRVHFRKAQFGKRVQRFEPLSARRGGEATDGQRPSDHDSDNSSLNLSLTRRDVERQLAAFRDDDLRSVTPDSSSSVASGTSLSSDSDASTKMARRAGSRRGKHSRGEMRERLLHAALHDDHSARDLASTDRGNALDADDSGLSLRRSASSAATSSVSGSAVAQRGGRDPESGSSTSSVV